MLKILLVWGIFVIKGVLGIDTVWEIFENTVGDIL